MVHCVRRAVLAVAFVCAMMHTCTMAHSNLGYPLPYNRVSCKATESWCSSTCPPVWRTGSAAARNSPQRPAAVWRRGQRVPITYHKNNHHGGFYRRALVPVRYMFNQGWHRRGVFEWGCWSQGEFRCGRSTTACGTDVLGRAYRTWMKVPRVFPDGDYVFVHAWYGGMHWRNIRPEFSDYHSCAFVRIRGGPTAKYHIPTFQAGTTKRRAPKGLCETGKYFLGQCRGAPCKRRGVLYARPGPFMNRRRPPVVEARWYTRAVMKHGTLKTTPSVHNAIRAEDADKRRDLRLMRESARRVAKQRSSPPRARPRARFANPVRRIVIVLANKAVRNVYNGKSAYIRVDWRPVTFEAFTANARPSTVVFRVRGRPAWVEKHAPYVYYANRRKIYNPWPNPIFNKWFTLFVDARAKNGRWYSTRVNLYLARRIHK